MLNSQNSGFSFIEVIFIVFLIAITSSLVIPRFYQSNKRVELETDASELLSLLTAAQSSAYSTKSDIELSIDIDGTGSISGVKGTLPSFKSTIENDQLFTLANTLICTSNVLVDTIIFSSDNSWEFYYNSTALTETTMYWILSDGSKNKKITFYPESQRLHLQ